MKEMIRKELLEFIDWTPTVQFDSPIVPKWTEPNRAIALALLELHRIATALERKEGAT